MNVYVDSSVLLRVILGEPGRLESWSRITRPISSELICLESLRTIDRARIAMDLPDQGVAERRASVLEMLDAFSLVPISREVLQEAEGPYPTMLGSLDAIHLASALLARHELEDLSIATHDVALAVAARAVGFTVLG